MNHEDKQGRIDAYLLGKAGPEARREFEEEIARNKELTAAMGDTELAIAAIEFHEDQAIKARLQKLEQSLAAGATTPEETQTEPVVRSIADRRAKTIARVVAMKQRRAGQLKLFGYAAALLLLLAVGWWAVNLGGGFDAPQLAMDSFRPYDNITTGTVRGDNDGSAEAAAFADYDGGDYAAAEAKFSALPSSDVNQFYLAQSLLAQEKFAEARTLFAKLAQQPGFALAPESNYYFALAELGVGNVDEARKVLSGIAADGAHPLQKETADLLEKLY